MSERNLHPLILFQREARSRLAGRWARNRTTAATAEGKVLVVGKPYEAWEIGAQCVFPAPRDPSEPRSRQEQRAQNAKQRNIAKGEASSTKRQRINRDRRAARMIAYEKLKAEVGGADAAVLHRDNPYVPLQIRRKLRPQKPSKLTVVRDVGAKLIRRASGRSEIVTPSGIILPGRGAA